MTRACHCRQSNRTSRLAWDGPSASPRLVGHLDAITALPGPLLGDTSVTLSAEELSPTPTRWLRKQSERAGAELPPLKRCRGPRGPVWTCVEGREEARVGLGRALGAGAADSPSAVSGHTGDRLCCRCRERCCGAVARQPPTPWPVQGNRVDCWTR